MSAKTPELDLRENYNKNYIINGDMGIWQRGNPIAISSTTRAYTSDRFCIKQASGTVALTVSRISDVPSSMPVLPYSAKIQRNAANTNTTLTSFSQAIESTNMRSLRGKKITLTFWAKAGANFSGALAIDVSTVSSTDDDPTNYSGAVFLLGGFPSIGLTTSWQKFSFTSTTAVLAAASSMRCQFRWTPSGTADADDSFYITGLMLTEGTDQSIQFRLFSNGDFSSELSACQRYFESTFRYGVTPAQNTSVTADGINCEASIQVLNPPISTVHIVWRYQVPKRVAGSPITYNLFAVGSGFAVSGTGNNAVTLYNNTIYGNTWYNTNAVTSGVGQMVNIAASVDVEI